MQEFPIEKVGETPTMKEVLLSITDTVFYHTADAKFLTAVLPKGDVVWRAAGVRVDPNGDIFLGCGKWTYPFTRSKDGLYVLKKDTLAETSSQALETLTKNYKEALKELKKMTRRFP